MIILGKQKKLKKKHLTEMKNSIKKLIFKIIINLWKLFYFESKNNITSINLNKSNNYCLSSLKTKM